MRIHHLNAGTMCPRGARFLAGRGGFLERVHLICHVLLIESEEGLVLVDTGIGARDVADPTRLGRPWVRLCAPRLDPAETTVARVQALGFSPEDVRHIVLTHLDLDHAGGLPDFPRARVHVHTREHTAAVRRRGRGHPRYRPVHWEHAPAWELHDDGGERWFAFEAVRALSPRETDILLIPLHGHSTGHCGVAVRQAHGWLLHAGDAYFAHAEIEHGSHAAPVGLRYFQTLVNANTAQRLANQARLHALRREHGHEVTIVCSHDPAELLSAV